VFLIFHLQFEVPRPETKRLPGEAPRHMLCSWPSSVRHVLDVNFYTKTFPSLTAFLVENGADVAGKR
jgi:hypothetical protein